MNAKLNIQSKHKENRLFCTRFIRFLIALAAMTVSTTSAWAQTESITYLDYDRYPYNNTFSEASYDGPTKITSSSTSLSGWYYVEGNVEINSKVTLTGHTYLILCDGAKLTINPSSGDGIDLDGKDLTIYAQSSGSHKGKLIIKSDGLGISLGGNVTINGGDISVTPTSSDGIFCDYFILNGGTVTVDSPSTSSGIIANGGVTINGGKVSATGTSDGIFGRYVTINGGQVYAEGGDTYFAGIRSYGDDIELGWANASDFIKANSYSSTTSIDALKNFYIDGTTPLNAGSNISASSINGKTLTPNAATHTITLSTGITGGTITIDRNEAVANERVVVNATPETGKMLTSLTYTYGSTTANITKQANEYAFTMPNPNADVTINATFETIVAQIGTTNYASLAAALAALPDNTATTIDILDDIAESGNDVPFGDKTKNFTINMNGHNVTFGSLNSFLGSMTVEGLSTGDRKTFTFNGIHMLGDLKFKNVTVNCTSISDWADNDEDKMLLLDNATVVCNNSTARSLSRGSRNIQLKNSSSLTIWNEAYLGSHNFLIEIKDNSWIEFKNCVTSGYNPTRVSDQIARFVRPDITIGLTESKVTMTTGGDPSTTTDMLNLVLRASWGIVLKNGLSNATTTFYDGGTSFDPTAFSPSAYTSTLYVDNNDGNDHYVIAHIVPDPFYWTDLSLLTHQESKSSGADTPAGLTLLKADQYNVNALDPSLTPDWRDRLDGAGWYYYILPGDKTVANDYTTSSIGGEVVEMFNLSTMTATQDFTNKTITYSRTTDDWTAVLTYDKMRWKFNGTTEFPQLTKVVINKAGTAVYTLDNATDIANHLTNNYSGNQFVVDYDTPIQPSSANSYCWFFGYDGNSYFTVEVPFTTPSTTPPLGSANNQWLIRNADELNLLSKCFSIGCWLSGGQYFLQTDDINMSGVNDFLPIGVNNPGPSFQGNYDGNGKTISNLSVTYSKALIPGDPTNAYIGLFGLVEGTSDAKASVDNVTLKNCSFSATAGSCAAAVGGIAGSINEDATISNCKVLTTSAISGLSTGCATGAIIGTFTVGTLSKNYYGYGVTVTNSSGTAKEYTKRGLWMGSTSSDGGPTTYAWSDFTLSDGAVLWVKKASFETITKPDGSTSTIAFSQKTPGDNCYALDGNDVLYAVGQPITLTVTEGQSKADGLRTFYDGLSGLTVNGSSDGVNLANRSFSMPETDATIAATFTPSKWFTILSNGKAWMSFYHEWKDANNAPENYTISDYNTAGAATPKTIEVKTITAADSKTGEVTFGNLEGVSYSGMPTLFHCETVLPDVLKFTPNTTATTTVTPATQFIGVATATQLSGDGIYVMNGDGDFIWASDTSEKLGAHKCYVDLGKAAGRRLTVISDDNATGIHSIDNGPSTMDDADGAWYSIDGRKLQGKPTKKGLYIYKGKKTVIK